MKIAILGGGLTGLTAAYYLAKENHDVTIFEKESFLGGIASGFKMDDWSWYLDKTYRHIFSNDSEFLGLCDELGVLDKMIFSEPETASLYPVLPKTHEVNIYRIFPVDSPQDFLKLPFLSLPEKIRAGLIVAFLKFSPFLSLYEKQTANRFLRETMGQRVWDVLWEELFRKKFGKYAENILASFIWARIKKRTKKLGYYQGGFQNMINLMEKTLKEKKVIIHKNFSVNGIRVDRGEFIINDKQEKYAAIISTLATPIILNTASNLLPNYYINRLKQIKYLWSVTQILETQTALFDKTYWVNVYDKNIPIMGLVQQTNYVDKKFYGGKHILYIGNYVDDNDARLKMNDKELFNYYFPYLKKINTKYLIPDTKYYTFRFPFSQPIFDAGFLKNKPDYITPIKNFYIANQDLTYPYDRGSNYAVSIAKKVCRILLANNS